jgi:hypothetical protein
MSSFTFFALLSLLSSAFNFSDNPESRIVQIEDDDNLKYDKIKTNNVMMASSSAYDVSPNNVLNIHLTGTWKNRFGSMLMIESADNGHIYGKYKLSSIMKTLSLNKNVNTSAWYRIHGTYDSNEPTTTLAWSVSWAKVDEAKEKASSSSSKVIKNTMAWCGRLANGGYMHLMLMMSNGDSSVHEWESISVTKDEFNKIKGESK